MGQDAKSQLVPVSKALVFNLSESPAETTEISAGDASLSQHAKWVALTQTDGFKNFLLVQSLQNPTLKFEVAQGTKGQSFQAKWSGDDLLAYVEPTSLTEGALRVATVSEKTSSLISQISTPYPLRQIVCPSWRGTTLFYGNSSNNKLSILKSKRKSGAWQSYIFATPNASNKGFGCPNAERNNP